MTKFFSICILCCLVSLLRAGECVVFEDFESPTSMHLKKIKGVSHSSRSPFHGSSHVIGQMHQFEMTFLIANYDARTQGFLVSCFVDPKGQLNQLQVTVANATYTAEVDPSIVGYRQVVIYIPNHSVSLAELVLKAQGNGGEFLLDDLTICDFNGILPNRPEPTQMLANYRADDKDRFQSISLNGSQVNCTHSFVADGYVFLPNALTYSHQDQTLSLTLQLENRSTYYQYGVWVDFNRDGQFSDDEQQLILNSSGDVDVTIPFDNHFKGDYPIRVRILNTSVSSQMNPYSGNAWGQTIDFMLREADQTVSATCNCTSSYVFLDISGKELRNLIGAPPGVYLKVCDGCVEKIVHMDTSLIIE